MLARPKHGFSKRQPLESGGTLIVTGEREFVSPPSREWTDAAEKRHYDSITGLTGPDIARRFRAVLACLYGIGGGSPSVLGSQWPRSRANPTRPPKSPP